MTSTSLPNTAPPNSEAIDEKTVKCIRCGFCGRGTLGSAPMRCSVNGSLGREIDDKRPTPWKRRPKKVVVVGGGVAGMQAAVALTMTDEYPYAYAQVIISAIPAPVVMPVPSS